MLTAIQDNITPISALHKPVFGSMCPSNARTHAQIPFATTRTNSEATEGAEKDKSHAGLASFYAKR